MAHLVPLHPHVLADPASHLPRHYLSHTSPEDKVQHAMTVARLVEEKYGYTVVAASVTGSMLRGMDRADSDYDCMVVVLDEPTKRRKHVTLRDAHDYDVALHGISEYSVKLSSSVPMAEMLYSPFMVVQSGWQSYFKALQPYYPALEKAAKRFVEKLIAQSTTQCEAAKTLRKVASVMYTVDHMLGYAVYRKGSDYYQATCVPRTFAVLADRVGMADTRLLPLGVDLDTLYERMLFDHYVARSRDVWGEAVSA